MKTLTLEVFTLDVWGNEFDGFDVNDIHRIGHSVEINPDLPDKEIDKSIYEQLRMQDIIRGSFNHAIFEWLDEAFCVISDKETGCPVFHLMGELP